MEEINKTLKIIDNLRKYCPHDKIRDYENVLSNLKDEMEEIRLAIKNNDSENLKEEIGDVLFNILFLSRIAKEKNGFELNEILKKTNKKIVYRHPHVFENKQNVTLEEADKIWKERKRLEKENNIIH